MDYPVPTFRPIANYPGYFVSDDGCVLSYRSPSKTKRVTPVILKPRAGKYGHCSVNLTGDVSPSKSFLIHALVMEAFVGPRPYKMDICHNNGNPMDNRLVNLRYDSHKGNHADQKIHGTCNSGDRNGRSKLTSGAVKDILARLERGEHKDSIALMYGVTETTVRDIKTRRTWSHLTSPA